MSDRKRLKEGDVIVINSGDEVYADIPEALVYSNRPGIWKLTHHIIATGSKGGPPPGKYIVTNAYMDGGGTGHGPNDIYPDGWHVFCKSAEHPHIEVDFYQSGSFSAMLPDKETVGKAKLTWKLDEANND